MKMLKRNFRHKTWIKEKATYRRTVPAAAQRETRYHLDPSFLIFVTRFNDFVQHPKSQLEQCLVVPTIELPLEITCAAAVNYALSRSASIPFENLYKHFSLRSFVTPLIRLKRQETWSIDMIKKHFSVLFSTIKMNRTYLVQNIYRQLLFH